MIMEMYENSRTKHSTHGSKAIDEAIQYLRKREDLYEIILKTYYQDYLASPFFKIYPNFQCWLKENGELK